MRKFTINPSARKAVYERSGDVCEQCHERLAVHVHHLTYARAGHELPEDLRHVCIVCHCADHPAKAAQIFEWEFRRRSRIAASFGHADQETEQEQRELEEEEYRYAEHEKQRQLERPEQEWNLAQYEANGYCLEDVEREERRNREYGTDYWSHE